MGFLGALPAVDTFATQFAKQLGGSVGEGIGNTPNVLMELLKHKRERQSQFGQSAVELAKMSGREPTLEDIDTAYSEGAGLAKPNMSPAEMQKALLGQAVKREDKLSRIEGNIDPERGWKTVTDLFTGESPEDRSSKQQKLEKQLKESGMSTRKKREILSKKLQPEEIEERVNPLTKEDLGLIGTFPDLKSTRPKKTGLFGEEGSIENSELTQPQREYFKSHLGEVYEKNPNANPLLVRREFEKKGVSWREYRDMIDQLQQEGKVDFSNNEDFAQLEKYLAKPPLGPLNEILHGFKLIGR